MSKRSHFTRKQNHSTYRAPRPAAEPMRNRSLERKPPTQYGKPFILLEDAEKNTFEFANGAWVPYAMTIAECRAECQVKVLPQQVSGKTRYEIRLPLPVA